MNTSNILKEYGYEFVSADGLPLAEEVFWRILADIAHKPQSAALIMKENSIAASAGFFDLHHSKLRVWEIFEYGHDCGRPGGGETWSVECVYNPKLSHGVLLVYDVYDSIAYLVHTGRLENGEPCKPVLLRYLMLNHGEWMPGSPADEFLNKVPALCPRQTVEEFLRQKYEEADAPFDMDRIYRETASGLESEAR